jgi:UDP-N-acetylmuramoyl-tripeptide--D-alanyl-D-alanine ligase
MDFELFYTTSGVCTDTRKITKDCLFICLRGENFNGNTFAKTALEQGAKYVIVDEIEYAIVDSIFYVKDALKYLQDLAHYHRAKFTIPVIGITGSNGKTTTKELINSVLSQKFHVLATFGNLNNHIGVPLTLLRLTKDHDIAIIEMGANKLKDIAELCAIASPNLGIITNIGKAHLEGFLNFEGVLKTKRELYEFVAQSLGKIIVNQDDEVLQNALPSGISTISYGTSSLSDIIGKLQNLTPFIEMSWRTGLYQSEVLTTAMVGQYNFYNFLAAITFGIKFGLTPAEINIGITSYLPNNNRSQVKKTATNQLILDCYNANPSSMKSAIDSFALINNQNKLLIIGDMLELGDESEMEHVTILNQIEELGINTYTVGPVFGKLACNNLILKQFENTTNAKKYLQNHPISNTLILLKGSRAVGLEVLEEAL